MPVLLYLYSSMSLLHLYSYLHLLLLSHNYHLMSFHYLVYMWYYYHLYYNFIYFLVSLLSHLSSHNFRLLLHLMSSNSLSSHYFIHLCFLWNYLHSMLHLSMHILLSYLLHFMHYPLPLLLLSDFIHCSDLIHNLLCFHNFNYSNYNLNFNILVSDL